MTAKKKSSRTHARRDYFRTQFPTYIARMMILQSLDNSTPGIEEVKALTAQELLQIQKLAKYSDEQAKAVVDEVYAKLTAAQQETPNE